MIFLFSLVFIVSIWLLYFSSNWLTKGLSSISRFLGLKEFVVAFFAMALAGAIPNLFVGFFSAVHKNPSLALGDVLGGNVIDLTLAVALAVFFVKEGIPARSRTIQTTSLFTLGAAILPLILLLDGELSFIDGIVLVLYFILYLIWLFSKEERFKKVYEEKEEEKKSFWDNFKSFSKNLWRVFLSLIFLLLAAEGIVVSSLYFGRRFNLPLILIGTLIVGLGNTLPEISCAVSSAKKGEGFMVLGDLMGSVIAPASLVLGIVSMIYPIKVSDLSFLAVARFFLVLSVLFFFIFIRTDRKVTKKEGIVLFFVYLIFVIAEILIH